MAAQIPAPGGNWWTEDAATVATVVALLNEQAAEANRKG